MKKHTVHYTYFLNKTFYEIFRSYKDSRTTTSLKKSIFSFLVNNACFYRSKLHSFPVSTFPMLRFETQSSAVNSSKHDIFMNHLSDTEFQLLLRFASTERLMIFHIHLPHSPRLIVSVVHNDQW